MAPEQIRNQPVTPQSDIYSLGVVIYEMLTGQRPTQGATGLEEILNRVLEAPPSPRSINPTLSRHWEAIILRCLERDPARRFQSVADLLVALESKWQLPRFAPSRRTILTVSGSLAVIAAGSRYWYQKPFLAAKLLLVPLENHTADHEFENLTSMLLHQLSQSPSLELITQNRMQQLQEQLGLSARAEVGAAQYREMALRDGAAGVVFSSLSVSGSEYNLHFRIEESGGTPFKPGRTWSKDFAASSKRDLFSRIDDASRWLRQQSGEALDQIARADRPVEDTTTNSWEAWRLYWDSKVLAAKSDLPGAIALIDEALRLDPVFAMAWRDRADYQIRLHEYREGFESWSKALAALDARRNTSLEALRTRAMYFEDVWKPSAAEEVYRRILAIRPGDYPAVLYLGSVVARQRRLNEAMQLFESALSLHPEKIQILTHIMPLHLSETRLDEANEVASRLRTSGLIAWADYADFNVAMTARKWGKALGSARNLALTGDKLWQVRGSLVLASCCGTLGRFSEALQALENALKAAMRHGSREWIERLPVWILHLELKQSQRSFSSVLSQWRALNATLRSPASIADYCFLGTLLGVKVSEAGSSWPDLPPFLARQKLLAFFANPSDQTGRAVLLASEGCPAFIARDLHESVASIFLHLRRSDAASIQALHKGQLSSWWANELNIPARIQVN